MRSAPGVCWRVLALSCIAFLVLGPHTWALVALAALSRRTEAAAEGEEPTPTTPNAASSSAEPTEASTESYDEEGSDAGSDLGSEIVNILLDIVSTLMSLFSDPPAAIQKMLDHAKELLGGARSVMRMGPEGARQARLMIQEATKILESARRMMLTTSRVANTAHQVVDAFSRPWRG